MTPHFGLSPLPSRESYDTLVALGSGARGHLANSFSWNCSSRLPLTPTLSRKGRGRYFFAQSGANL